MTHTHTLPAKSSDALSKTTSMKSHKRKKETSDLDGETAQRKKASRKLPMERKSPTNSTSCRKRAKKPASPSNSSAALPKAKAPAEAKVVRPRKPPVKSSKTEMEEKAHRPLQKKRSKTEPNFKKDQKSLLTLVFIHHARKISLKIQYRFHRPSL